MYYSVTFENSDHVKKNTWSDWRLIPSKPPMFNPPEIEVNYVIIPGRTKGPIALPNPSRNNIEGEWTFIADDEALPRIQMFDVLKTFMHGKYLKVVFEEDPLHYYEGFFYVGEPQTGSGATAYTIRYAVSPARFKLDGTEDGV